MTGTRARSWVVVALAGVGCLPGAQRAQQEAHRLAAAGDLDAAVRVLAPFEHDPSVACTQGELALARGRPAEAAAAFERTPNAPCAVEGRAAAALQQGRGRDAATLLEGTTASTPRGRLLRARVQLALGTPAGATQARAVLAGLSGAEAAYLRACAALVLGEPAQASTEAAKAELDAPTAVWGAYARARIAAHGNAKGAALAALADVKARWPGPQPFAQVRDDPAFAFLAPSEEFQRLTDAGP